jgi:hypothetical protein
LLCLCCITFCFFAYKKKYKPESILTPYEKWAAYHENKQANNVDTTQMHNNPINNNSTHNPIYATMTNKQFTTRSVPLPPRKNPIAKQSIPNSYRNDRRSSHRRSDDSTRQYEMYTEQKNFHGVNPLHKES